MQFSKTPDRSKMAPSFRSITSAVASTPPREAAPSDESPAPALLREWKEPQQHELQSPLPVAPAVVLPVPCNHDDDDGKPAAVYPIATFVTNLVRNSIDHIYAGIAEAIDETPITSVRSEAAMETIRQELRRDTRSESDLFLPNDDEYVLIDGDLVAIPAPPPNSTEQEDVEFQQQQHSTKNRMRRSMRGLRKWMKKRQGKKNDLRNQPAEPPVKNQSSRKIEKRKLSIRRSKVNVHENTQIPPRARSPPPGPTTTSSVTSVNIIGAVAASFMGNSPLQNVASALAYIESDEKSNGKVDKVEEMHLESMLQLARLEVEQDNGLEDCIGSLPPAKTPIAKHSNVPCPLSKATTDDFFVTNDTLKVIMMGDLCNEKSQLARAIGGKKPKRPRCSLGVDVHTWKPKDNLTFTIWDVSSVHAGAHPSTQGLFFSAKSLYILVWDLGVSNRMTFTKRKDTEDDDDDDDDENDNEFLCEENQRQADRALHHDIQDHVLSWLDRIIPSGSAILPVASVASGMENSEVQRRCGMLQNLLVNHPAIIGDQAPNLIFGKNNPILLVNLLTGEGFPELQETVLAIGREGVFSHVGKEVSKSTMQTLEVIRRLKQDRKVILLDHLLSEMNEPMITMEEVTDALQFLSNIGEILYFGNSADDILSRYVILSRKWLVSALSCILRPDLQRELAETRRFMNLQCVYSGEAFVESDTVQTLLKGTNSSCPVLSAKDSAMLWQSMVFMKEAADQTAQLSEASNTMYDFLERLLVHFGILLPLKVAAEPTYFVPSLLDQREPSDVWRYKTSDAWMTTLCHSWLLQDGIPTAVMEHVTTNLLQDLYEFSNTFHGQLARPLFHAKTLPIGSNVAMKEFLKDHNQEPIGRIKINQVMCWESSVLIKIGSVIADEEHNELRESPCEVYVAVVDDQSKHCVDIKGMRNGMKRLIVCGKGQVGRHGHKLWKGGYGLVLDSIKASLADSNGFDRHVVCPECLAHLHPSCASAWSWEYVKSSAYSGDSAIRCAKGHSVDTNLLCGHGICPSMVKPPPPSLSPRVSKKVKCLLNSVVLVGLWDSQEKRIKNVGSGFVADQSLGLVVTARHILFDLDGPKSGIPYFGLKHGKAIIGVIPDGSETAVFRYFAEIVSENVQNVDACVLRITARMEQDMIGDGEGCASQSELPVSCLAELPELFMTSKFELEESVRIVGFNQGGEDVLEKGKHVNLSVDFAKGYICKIFKVPVRADDENSDSSSSSSSISTKTFSPLEEIVVDCKTISGHSGGPCVNGEGKVIGILSRADRNDRQRCYLVPGSQLKKLVRNVKKIYDSGGRSKNV